MKKVIALKVIMAILSTTVFATPLSVAGSLDALSREASLTTQKSSERDADLFADVQAVDLTAEEAQAVEGEGFSGAIGGIAAVRTVAGAIQQNAINKSKASCNCGDNRREYFRRGSS